MNFKEFTASQNDSGKKLEKILKILWQKYDLQKKCGMYSAIKKGLVKINNSKSKENYQICCGDKIQIAEFLFDDNSTAKNKKSPEDMEFRLETVFKNQHLLIINKPYGINCQKSTKTDLSIADYLIQPPDEISFKPAPLHRLDKNTTGLLCISQSSKGAQTVSEWIKNHQIKKTYIGIVQGKLESLQAWENKIIDPLQDGVSKEFHTVKCLPKNSPEGKTALTTAKPLKYGTFNNAPVTLVEFNIHTGRKHQIRSQSSFHGYPLLGDKAYKGFSVSLKKEFFLCANKLEFPPNQLGIPREISIPVPEDFFDFFK